jgi:hypothetical protein
MPNPFPDCCAVVAFVYLMEFRDAATVSPLLLLVLAHSTQNISKAKHICSWWLTLKEFLDIFYVALYSKPIR